MKDERKLELNFKLELARLPRLEGTADCRSETNVDQRMQIATNKCAPPCLGLLLFGISGSGLSKCCPTCPPRVQNNGKEQENSFDNKNMYSKHTSAETAKYLRNQGERKIERITESQQ